VYRQELVSRETLRLTAEVSVEVFMNSCKLQSNDGSSSTRRSRYKTVTHIETHMQQVTTGGQQQCLWQSSNDVSLHPNVQWQALTRSRDNTVVCDCVCFAALHRLN